MAAPRVAVGMPAGAPAATGRGAVLAVAGAAGVAVARVEVARAVAAQCRSQAANRLPGGSSAAAVRAAARVAWAAALRREGVATVEV